MKKFNPKLPLVLAASFLSVLPTAHAINSINVQTFNPSTSDHFVFLEDGFKSEWPKTAKFYFGANYNYQSDPLVVLDPSQASKSYNIIDSIQTFDFFFGFKASNNLGLFIGAPVHFIDFSSAANSGGGAVFPTGSQTSFGDVKIEAKIRITDDASPTSIALIPEFHLPTGGTQYFVSDASAYVGLRAAIERQFDTFTLVGNLGFAAAANAIYQDASTFANGIDYRKRLIIGIGGFLPFNDSWGMNVEFNNIAMIPFDKTLNPNDLYAGLRYAANDSFVLTAGGAIGKIGGPSGADYRIVAGIRYTVLDQKKTAPQPIYIAPKPLPSPSPMPMMSPTPAPLAMPTPSAPIIASNAHAVMRAKRIEILTPITFEHDAYKLTPDSRQILDDVASLMNNNKTAYKKVLIDGHTSGSGTDKYNLKLSIARSRAVKSYLVTRGVPAKVLEARGFGKRNPKVSAKNPNAEEINRRVEFIIVK